MGETLKNLLGICLLRKGPQDIPYSPTSLLVFIAVGAALSHVAGSNIPGAGSLYQQIAISVVFGLLFTYAALVLRNAQERFMQSATAIFGVDAVIALPVALATFELGEQSPAQAPTTAFIILLLWLWNISVLGHIFRHALDIRLPLGILVAIFYSFLGFQVVQLSSS